MAEDTDGVLESTVYPVLTAWGFTTEENSVPSDVELTELLKVYPSRLLYGIINF